jgi:two-component system LytT family sensor kinase
MTLGRARLWALAAVGWILFGIISGLLVWLSMIDHHHSVVRMVLHYVAVWSAWIPIGFAVARLVRRFPPVPPSARSVLVHLLSGTVIAVLHGVFWVTLERWIVPFDAMTPGYTLEALLTVIVYQSPLELMFYALVALAVVAYDADVLDRQREVRAAQLETLLAEARLQALETQIRPHFLFNTLNAVSALVHTGDRDRALAVIGGLSDLLRYALDRASAGSATVDDEVAMARRYLEIQQIRFPDRLTFAIDVAPQAGLGAVPALLLQPLIENAVRHGMETNGGAGRVEVGVLRSGDTLAIRIRNSGRLGAPRQDGIGLANTQARLAQAYAGRHTFSLRQEGDWVVAAIGLPWSEAG